MAKIFPFRGIRYNQKVVGDLSQVVTQPYDRIGPKEEAVYLGRSPYNFVRLIGTKIPPQDEGAYAKRAELFREWLSQGILVRDEFPGFYLYRVRFSHEGKTHERWGFVALLDLRESQVKKHERTLRGPKEDRLKLFRATEAHLEHIFLLYRDPERRATQALLSAAGARPPDMYAKDDFGNTHEMWHVSDPAAVEAVQAALMPFPVYIADGHHRFETAGIFMEECVQKGWKPVGPESFTSIPVTLVNVAEPGCVIRPTPRVVHNLPRFSLAEFLRKVQEDFQVEECADFAAARERLRQALACGEKVFVAISAGKFLALKLRKKPEEVVPGEHAPAWKRLDVAILHKAILEKILGIDEETLARGTHVEYTHTAEEAVALMEEGRGQIAFLLNPTQVEDVLAVADAGEPMPQKSTDFYPKLLSGLVAMKMEIVKG
ncbi:MAG: DUF1015 domain-containing protein [Candidatus Bipolaricaulaceae bacterium]